MYSTSKTTNLHRLQSLAVMDPLIQRERDLRKRLLQDIAELQTNPYPNITLHVDDRDITRACLVLTPENWRPLHLTVEFPTNSHVYPLKPPVVRMDSSIYHPNVFGGYICASILNTTEGYTPAYTLKAIAIQLLSFFGSDSVQQDYGAVIKLESFRDRSNYQYDAFLCHKCFFGHYQYKINIRPLPASGPPCAEKPIRPDQFFINLLPNEILLQVIDHLDFQDLTNFARSWSRISRLVTNFNVIRKRELRCFLLKESFLEQKLGIGIHLSGNGRYRELSSEFDLLSQQAFETHRIRRSIQGLDFEHWLPLPISQGHWRRVQGDAYSSLAVLSKESNIGNNSLVIFSFMNNIITKLNSDLERQNNQRGNPKSTLLHASDKAIESYFHLFHLLLCIATGPGGRKIVDDANRMIRNFMAGKTEKSYVPNLGNLLVALLISDVEPTEAVMKAIVKEAITRNVVWMLDAKRGAGMAELAYLETDKVSKYRLKKTYQASRVSYRILMFSELFRRTARPSPPKSASPSPAPKSSRPPQPANVATIPTPNPAPVAPPPNKKRLWSQVAGSKPPSKPSPPKSYSSAVTEKLPAAVEKPPVAKSSAAPKSYSSVLADKPAITEKPPQDQPSFPQPPRRKTLIELRDELFTRHGAPPLGAATKLATEVRRLQEIDDFRSFLKEMGVSFPGKETFTAVLRECMRDSAAKGYHVWRPAPNLVAGLRIVKDPGVDPLVVASDIRRMGYRVPGPADLEEAKRNGRFNFFPGRGRI